MLARLNKPAVLWALRVVLGYLGRVQSMIGTDSSRDDFRTSSPVYASGLYCWESTHHGYHFSSRVQRPVDLFSGAYCSLVEGPHFPLSMSSTPVGLPVFCLLALTRVAWRKYRMS